MEVLEECKPQRFVLYAEGLAEVLSILKVSGNSTGLLEYQILSLTARVACLRSHLTDHTKDHASTRGLLKEIVTRTKLLKYLKSESTETFHNIIEGLKLRIWQQLLRF